MKIKETCRVIREETWTVEFDICPKCFDEVLVPFLKSKGAEPRVEENDW